MSEPLFKTEILTQLENAYAEADTDMRETLNVTIVENISNLDKILNTIKCDYVKDQQLIAIDEHRKLKDCIATVQHWISMRTEKIECGDEFGAEIQVTITHGLQNTANEVTRLVGDMTQILRDKVNLNNPKLAGDDTDRLRLSYNREYRHQFISSIRAMRRFYFQIVHSVKKNCSALQQPKSGFQDFTLS